MDAGTFVFELNGVRWVLDPGNQSYYPLNRIGFKLSDHSQDGERWTLLTKKNQGHSTITVNDARFLVNGQATFTGFKDSGTPEVTVDMTPVYGNNLKSLSRRFVKESNQSVLIEDRFRDKRFHKNNNLGIDDAGRSSAHKNRCSFKAGWQNPKTRNTFKPWIISFNNFT
jgi:hypothetical protein